MELVYILFWDHFNWMRQQQFSSSIKKMRHSKVKGTNQPYACDYWGPYFTLIGSFHGDFAVRMKLEWKTALHGQQVQIVLAKIQLNWNELLLISHDVEYFLMQLFYISIYCCNVSLEFGAKHMWK